ncbi:protein Cep89 homolog [Cylas formicarius]|uniref:protein Cep89 homolog n=1 Tax=Cylas formicarius TaxID=197179 RepID=UPI0029587746|nr:protein Cep89 homolog [Cylas formicarius]
MSASEGLYVPKRKHVTVPVHRSEREKKNDDSRNKKTYSANFSSRRHKANPKQNDGVIPERETPKRTCRKTLSKEVERLNQENQDLTAKFNELEDLSVKRILKLKEKVTTLQNINAEIANETHVIRRQYQELLEKCEDAKSGAEVSKACENCQELGKIIDKLSAENEECRLNNKELNEDLNMLKTVVYRLNLQLERYQDKLRLHNLHVDNLRQNLKTSQSREGETVTILSSDHINHRHTPIAWGNVNRHTLGPLLDAYQDAISEKEEIIQSYETEMSRFTGKLKEIIEENETLYKKLTEDERCSAKLAAQLERLKAELKGLKDQNDALIKKCAIKQDKIEEILKVYENKVEQMKRDYKVVHEEYIKMRTENASLKERNKSLVDHQDDFKSERQNYIPISVHTASVSECKRLYEELKGQYEAEMSKLKANVEAKEKSIAELNAAMASIKKQKESLESKVAKLEKELKKSEAKQLDLEHSINEVQLSKSACRKQLHKAMNFAKDMVAEQEALIRALNQRQLENKAVKSVGSEMAVKMDSLKTQLKDVQKTAWQEFTTVEQKIQEQTEMIESLKDSHQKEIEKLHKVIAGYEQMKVVSRDDHVPLSHYQLFKDKYK